MKTQQLQNPSKNVQRTIGNLGLWLGLAFLVFVAALAIQNVSRRAAIIPNTGSFILAQTVPEAAAQGVTDYIRAHSDPSAQAVPEAGVQSVADYLRLHSADLPAAVITDPAVQSVMGYLEAHGTQP